MVEEVDDVETFTVNLHDEENNVSIFFAFVSKFKKASFILTIPNVIVTITGSAVSFVYWNCSRGVK